MIPRLIKNRIGQLRTRERLIRLAWGAARWLALIVAVILFGCFVDWLWDRTRDTPFEARVALLGLTCGAALAAFLTWVLVPLLTRLRDDDLALWVEDKTPTLRHRLISAIQLNRPGAGRQGMSDELIVLVTKEAEEHAGKLKFTDAADHGRIKQGFKYLIPIIALAAGLYAAWPKMSSALLARHFLADVEIPRSVYIDAVKPHEVRPAGEKVKLEFRVKADSFDEAMAGTVIITPKDQPSDRYLLTYSHNDEKTGEPIFATEVAASTIDFTYTARLGDGRLKHPGQVTMVPRPAVLEQMAWTLLPLYCGQRPNGEPYEVPQPKGDVIGIPGSSAKVLVKTQRTIAKAHLELLGPKAIEPGKSLDDLGPEVMLRSVPCKVEADGLSAIGRFELKPQETGYRIVLEDEYGFLNIPPPRRNVRIVPEEPPTVVLLKDYFTPTKVDAKGSLDDFYIEGMPVPIGEMLRVPYLAEGPYGLGQSWFLFRVLKKVESGNDIVEEEPFKRLPLSEVVGNEKTGPFDLRRGIFENTPPDKGVDFVALPSPNPDFILGRTVGGGRFHFKTSGIPDGKGGVLELKDGDKIEYCIEIHADKGKNPGRPTARSESRVQVMGTYEALGKWIRDIAQEERRLREIDGKQRVLFGNP